MGDRRGPIVNPENKKKRVLITGISGLLGNNLALSLRERYELMGLYHSHPVMIDGIQTRFSDLLSEDSLRACVNDFEPDVVIHCASVTNVDFCETNRDLARRVCVSGTRSLATSLEPRAKLVYISTDLVYDGKKGNFSESDPVNPLNHYGKCKHEGELESLRHADALVLRTNIFGWNIQDKLSLAEWILNELTNKRPIRGFTDATFSSIYTMELARLLDQSLQKDLRGVYNCGSSTSLSKYEFAVLLAKRFGLDASLIRPISIDDFHLMAKRGKNLSLDIGKLAGALDSLPPGLADSIESFHRDFATGLPERIKKNNPVCAQYPRLDFIPYGRQSVDQDDIQAVVDVLKSSHLTQGPKIAEFEEDLCRTTGAGCAVAVNSGTSALHIACLAAGIGEGDEAITSPNTFVASANCVVYCGGTPVFADIDPKTYNLSPEEIERKITPKTKAVIPVHFAGHSCEMEKIHAVVKAAERKHGHKIYMIEDASHALGSLYQGRQVGSCVFSDMAVLSFHPVKHITTGEGGAVLTNDTSLNKKLRRLRSHGITSAPPEFVLEKGSTSPWYYEMIELGYNYRITDIQCALGLSQMRKLSGFLKRRREIVHHYNERFKNIEALRTPYESPDCYSNFHLYVLLFDFEKIGTDRSKLMIDLKGRGIQTQVHYIPVYSQPFYQQRFGTRWGDCPQAESYYKQCLSIPLFPAMTDGDVDNVINEILKAATHG